MSSLLLPSLLVYARSIARSTTRTGRSPL